MAAKYPDDDMDLQDQIRPEDSASYLTGHGSMTSSIVRTVKARRAAAARKLLAIKEESALAEMESRMKQNRLDDELEMEKRKRQLEFEIEEKKRLIEEEKRKQMKAEQCEMSLNAEWKRLEAEKELLEAEEEESIVSLARSKVSQMSRSRTSVTIRRPTMTPMASTPIPDRHQSSLLQEVTPLKGIFSQDSITGTRIDGMGSAISNPPSYATHDPFNESASKNHSIYDTTSERSLNLSFAEQPRQESKTMTGDDEDQENAEQLEQEINTLPRTACAEAAARAARAAE